MRVCLIFRDPLAGQLVVFVFMQGGVLHRGLGLLKRKVHVCRIHSVRDFCKGNYCIWLSVKRTACNFLMACRDTDVKLVILTEIRAC